jgi:hypothetical protein
LHQEEPPKLRLLLHRIGNAQFTRSERKQNFLESLKLAPIMEGNPGFTGPRRGALRPGVGGIGRHRDDISPVCPSMQDGMHGKVLLTFRKLAKYIEQDRPLVPSLDVCAERVSARVGLFHLRVQQRPDALGPVRAETLRRATRQLHEALRASSSARR